MSLCARYSLCSNLAIHNREPQRLFSVRRHLPQQLVNVAVHSALRWYFVRFQETPNETCYKFYVDNVLFLPESSQTLLFDRTNDYQSPLAHSILSSLPMVHEVTLGSTFLTVHKVQGKEMAQAAAREFANRLNSQDSLVSSEKIKEDNIHSNIHSSSGSNNMDNNVKNAITTSVREPSNTINSINNVESLNEKETKTAHDVESNSCESDAIDEGVLMEIIENMEWDELRLHISAIITDHLYSHAPHIALDAPPPHSDTEPCSGDSDVVLMIKEFIATTIRPELQHDGGDVKFICFNEGNGELLIELLGACRTCGNHTSVLFDLIDRSIRHWIPEVQEIKEHLATTPFEDDQIDESKLISSIKDGKVHFQVNDSKDSDSTTQTYLVREV